jgi:hypothetical protein
MEKMVLSFLINVPLKDFVTKSFKGTFIKDNLNYEELEEEKKKFKELAKDCKDMNGNFESNHEDDEENFANL